MKSYVHEQKEPAKEWKVEHNLGTTDLIIQVMVHDKDDVLTVNAPFLNVEGIKIINDNQIVVPAESSDFPQGTTGKVVIQQLIA